MFSWLQKISGKLLRKTTEISHEPLNKVSIVILIIIDIFVLINVFSGLDSIAGWTLTPFEQFPCFTAYQTYQTSDKKGTLDYDTTTIEDIIQKYQYSQITAIDYSSRLGNISPLCANYQSLEPKVNNKFNQNTVAKIGKLRDEVNRHNQEINTLKGQYDSTLLEKIAGQSPQNSINQTTADKIKSEIEQNQQKIKQKNQEIKTQKQQLIANSSSSDYLKLLNDVATYNQIKKGYESAAFWHPNQQLLLQGLFLLPLILLAYLWHSTSIRKNRGLQALLSWHLLLIFCIPFILKLFEFLQFSNLAALVIDALVTLLGGLVFIASYLLILIIPLSGFGLIKVLQRFVFNSRIQAKKRIQKVRCLNCNVKLRLNDQFCHHCGFEQYQECSHCHQKTYKLTNFCSHCGHHLDVT